MRKEENQENLQNSEEILKLEKTSEIKPSSEGKQSIEFNELKSDLKISYVNDQLFLKII